MPLLVLAVLALGLLAACGSAPPPASSAAPEPPAAVTLPRPEVQAAQAFAAWDLARSRAWAAGDASALRALYAPRSEAGRRDLAALRAWSARGLRVTGVRTQVLALRVLHRSAQQWRVAVRSRLAPGAVAVGPAGERLALPADRVHRRVLTLRRADGGWVLAPGPQRAARPVVTTASTSGSAKE